MVANIYRLIEVKNMNFITNIPSCILSLLLFSGFCSAEVQQQSIKSVTTLSIGSISNNPKNEVKKFQPLVDYIVNHLPDSNIKIGRIVVANSLQEMSDLISRGEVDIYIDSPFPVIAVGKNTGSVPFLRRWKKGVSQYRSVIFTHKDSGVTSIGDLKGKVVAFEEEFSTSGYFLPKATLLENKFIIVEKYRNTAPVSRDKVGYVFSQDDETTMIWVLRKKVAAGALNKKAFKEFSKSRRNELIILKETILVPRQVVVHRPGLPVKLRENIQRILLNMDKTSQGQSILNAFERTKKFDLIAMSELSEIAALFNLIESDFSY